MNNADVAVIGGGIHGLSAALNLARRGLRVMVLEKDHVGRHASGANAGGVRTLLRHEAEIPLALASRDIWHDIESELGATCGYHTVGQVAVAETGEAMNELVARADRMRALGYHHEELIDASELKGLAPGIVGSVRGGLIARQDGAASPYHATMAFREAALGVGVDIREGARVKGLHPTTTGWRLDVGELRIEAGFIVNAAGAWGGEIAAMIGDEVPLGYFLPMMMVTARVEPFLKPVVIGVDRPLSFKQMPNGTLVIGGGRPATGDRDTMAYRPDFSGLKASAATVRDLFPMLADVPVVRAWAGIEGLFADEIPVIGPSRKAARAVHAFGYCGHGFQLAPIVGRIVAELVTEGRTSMPIAAFAVDRFAAQVKKGRT